MLSHFGTPAPNEPPGAGSPAGPQPHSEQGLPQDSSFGADQDGRGGAKYPTAAFAAVGAPEKPFHNSDLGTLCCKANVRALIRHGRPKETGNKGMRGQGWGRWTHSPSSCAFSQNF